MKLRLWSTVVFSLGVWFLCWLWVWSDGDARKITAQAILGSVSTNIVNLDSHIANTMHTIDTDQRDGVFLLEVIDNDFKLVKTDIGSVSPNDGSALYYNVKTSKGEYYLRVNNRYFLENSGIVDNYSKELNGYTIIATPSETVINKDKIRATLGIGDDNYIYYRKVKELPDGQVLMVAAYIDKPMFYRVINPSNFVELLMSIAFIVLIGFLNTLVVHWVKCVMIKCKPAT